MALIQCPECGQTISDKAGMCPKCGYPTASVTDVVPKADATVPEQPTISEQAIREKKKPKKIILIISLIIVFIAIVAGIWVFFFSNLLGKVVVNSITLTKWKLTDSLSYGNDYEVTITSEQKKPFVAVISSSYDEKETAYDLAFVEKGEGKLTVYASKDEDPSVEYHAVGYYQAEKIRASEVATSYKDYNYDDYSTLEESDCYVDVDVKLHSKRNGILLVNIENITNNETEYNVIIPIVNGEGKHFEYATLPYKSRGIELSITPVCFIKSKSLSENDYTVGKEFSVKKVDKYYDGEGIWRFADIDNGFILYTKELTEGGDKSDRGIVNSYLRTIYDHEITITSYDRVEDGDLMPKYDINLIGYLPWTELIKGVRT